MVMRLGRKTAISLVLVGTLATALLGVARVPQWRDAAASAQVRG